MIEKIEAIGLKGSSFKYDITQLNVIIGPNGTGKTSISIAAFLCLKGYVPFGKVKKKPADILKAFSSDDKLVVRCTLKGVEFERSFTRSTKTGAVSQKFRVNKKKYSKDEFNSELFTAGGPRIVDVAAFMALSDNEKINFLSDYYGDKTAISKCTEEIEIAKSAISKQREQVSMSEGTLNQLKNSLVNMPTGQLSETQAEIKKIESELDELKSQKIKSEMEKKQKDIEEAKQLVKEKGSGVIIPDRINGQINDIRWDLHNTDDEINTLESSSIIHRSQSPPMIEQIRQEQTGQTIKNLGEKTVHVNTNVATVAPVAISIGNIIKAIDDAGCELCFAKIVAKKELKKWT